MAASSSCPNLSTDESDHWGQFISADNDVSFTSAEPTEPAAQPLARLPHQCQLPNGPQLCPASEIEDSDVPYSQLSGASTASSETPADTPESESMNGNPIADATAANFVPVPTDKPLQGFDTLDDVQRYAVGALAVALLNRHINDLNEVAFARTQCLAILDALQIGKGQQEALLSLDPSRNERRDVVEQCVNLVGDPPQRFLALQAMLALAVSSGAYDARSRAFLTSVAYQFGIAWPAVAAVELALAVHLLNEPSVTAEDDANSSIDTEIELRSMPDVEISHVVQIDSDTTSEATYQPPSTNPFSEDNATEREHDRNTLPPPGPLMGMNSSATPSEVTTPAAPTIGQLLIQRRKRKQRVFKLVKIGGITLVGGMLFGLTGGLIAPALLPALAGIGITSAASLAASGTIASGAVVGGLFGVAGGGFTMRKARRRVSTNLEEFDFERADDPRVIEERQRKANREQRKYERMVAQRLEEEAKANQHLAIEGAQPEQNSARNARNEMDADRGLPHPPPSDHDVEIEDLDDEDISDGKVKRKKHGPFAKHSKKREKRKVGVRALETTATVPSLHVCICVPAWLTDRGFGSSLDQFEPALKQELPYSQHIALRWESTRLYEMGLAFAKFWASKATTTTVQQAYPHAVAAASTVAGAVAFAFAIPLTVMSCMDYVDNPWSVLVSRSNGAGEELADVLVERSYGNRPVTLFGYSIGARVVFKCLESLASRGALGIVDNAFFMGAAVTADPERWRKVRKVVAGRLVNAYGSYDWALAFFHRGCGHGVYVSGLRRVELEGVENLNMAYLGIEGHRELKDCVPRVMRGMGIGLGYMSLPPAKLVIKGKKTASEAGQKEDVTTVCEEPGDAGWATSGIPSPTSSDEGDRFEDDRGDGVEIPNGIGNEIENPVEKGNGETPVLRDVEKEVAEVKKQKSKSWMSWSSWYGSSSSSKSKSKKNGAVSTKNADAENGNLGVISLRMEDMGDERPKETSVDSTPVVAEDGALVSINDVGLDSPNVDDATVAEIADANGAAEAFDWGKQREIWEEQERQMRERGYADTAAEIEMRNKVVLNISLEVAGRRLEVCIKQDSQLPVELVEHVFTNCADDQRGMHIRIYEHERKSKTMAINMCKWPKRYPKLIGEMELRLKRPALKGKLRVAVAVRADEEGNVHAWGEERFPDGSSGERLEVTVERKDLCSYSERKELEEAEKRQIEAELQRELRNKSAKRALALPAPESSGADPPGGQCHVENRNEVVGAQTHRGTSSRGTKDPLEGR